MPIYITRPHACACERWGMRAEREQLAYESRGGGFASLYLLSPSPLSMIVCTRGFLVGTRRNAWEKPP